MHDYKKLNVWKESIELITEVYKTTSEFPSTEKFGLISQINRCAVSIASNIAEGAGRNTDGEFRQFLGTSKGSSYELETQLIVSNNLGYISIEELNILIEKLEYDQKMIHNLIKSLK
ncbi:MAG: four helix bundle protein [Bacteroidetes bacterium]|nr:four helix bundle protein [Bacteroidota bacterium]